MLEVEEVQQAIWGGDEIHKQEVKLKITAKQSNSYDEFDNFLADNIIEKLAIEYMKEVTHRYFSEELNTKPSSSTAARRSRRK